MKKLTPSQQDAVDHEIRLIYRWLTGPHPGSDTAAWKDSIKPLFDSIAWDIYNGKHHENLCDP